MIAFLASALHLSNHTELLTFLQTAAVMRHLDCQGCDPRASLCVPALQPSHACGCANRVETWRHTAARPCPPRTLAYAQRLITIPHPHHPPTTHPPTPTTPTTTDTTTNLTQHSSTHPPTHPPTGVKLLRGCLPALAPPTLLPATQGQRPQVTATLAHCRCLHYCIARAARLRGRQRDGVAFRHTATLDRSSELQVAQPTNKYIRIPTPQAPAGTS